MNQNEARTFWISLGVALLAVLVLYSYMQEMRTQLTKKFGAKQRVVIAAQDINEMETIDETMLQVVERPNEFIEPQAVQDPEVAVGQIALAPIKKDEQLLQSKIIKPGPVTGLSLQVAPSKRAVTIPVDETRGVARLINPGDRIDLVAAVDVGKGLNQHREVATIMQDVPVLATGLRVVNDLPVLYEKLGREDFVKNLRGDTTFNSITVEASPDEAQKLIFILSTSPGSLYLTLRHPSDHGRNKMPEANIDSLLGKVSPDMMNMQQRAPAAPLPPPPKPAPPKKRRVGPFQSI